MLRTITSLFILLCLALAACAWSQSQGFTQIGNVLCQIPPGWQRAEQGRATVLVPPGVPQGKTALLIILPGQTIQGDLRAWFDQQWTGFRADSTVTEDSPAVADTSAGGYEFIYTAARLQDAAKKVTFVFFFVAQAGDQAQPFAYMTDDETLVAAHTAALKTFLGALTFANLQPAQPAAQPAGTPAGGKLSPSFTWGTVPPPSGSAGLSGIYHMQDLGAKLSVISGSAVTSIDHTYWCFFPDGRCYYTMPAEGLENFNYDYLRQMNNGFCCTYKMEGNNGIITWGSKDHPTFGFRRVGKQLVIKRDADVYDLLDPCDGLKLSGTFKRYDWASEYSPKEGITFSPDGTFVDEGFLHGAMSMWWWADRSYVDAESTPGRGTYHVASNSLALFYDDGRKLRVNFHLADEVARDDVTAFLINTWRYVRVK
jgi:hypothetical protein